MNAVPWGADKAVLAREGTLDYMCQASGGWWILERGVPKGDHGTTNVLQSWPLVGLGNWKVTHHCIIHESWARILGPANWSLKRSYCIRENLESKVTPPYVWIVLSSPTANQASLFPHPLKNCSNPSPLVYRHRSSSHTWGHLVSNEWTANTTFNAQVFKVNDHLTTLGLLKG